MKPIYLDHNASTPLAPEVIAIMQTVLKENFGNPSSGHFYGLKSREIVENAREKVANLIHAEPEEIIFTSGGSESNNMALQGVAQIYSDCHIITSVIEHPSVRKVCDFLEGKGHRISHLTVNQQGIVTVENLQKIIRDNTKLISVMLANNETGSLQPLKEICKIAKARGIIVHTDAAQAVGKIDVDVNDLGVDLLTIAAHKMYGPKGVGALYVRKGLKIPPLIYGANHEQGFRAGTENVLEIAGLGEAAGVFQNQSTQIIAQQQKLRDNFYQILKNELPDIELNGDESKRLPNTANIYFPHCNAEHLLKKIPEIAASAGAACHAGTVEPSAVLQAMGCSDERALGSVRFSFGRITTESEVEEAARLIIAAVGKTRRKKPLSAEKLTLSSSALGCSCKISAGSLRTVLSDDSSEQRLTTALGYENFDDAAVYFIDEKTAILTSVDFFSPIVEDPYDFGRIAAANALSDIYAMGGTPLFANNIVAFPENRLPLLRKVMQGAARVAQQAGIDILGGHSVKDDEIKYGLSVTGKVSRENLWRNQGAKTGDLLILTKALGSGILCQAMKKGLLNSKTIDNIVNYMAFLNKDAAEIMSCYQITACTDVSGFGLIGHLTEMLQGAGKSATLNGDKIPAMENVEKMVRLNVVADGYWGNFEYFSEKISFAENTSQLLQKLLFDPQTSGGLLFTVEASQAGLILQELSRAGMPEAIAIGKIIDKKEKLIYIE